MPSAAHRALVLWIARHMSTDGLKVAAFDGPSDQGGVFNDLIRPFGLLGVKPDVWAIDKSGQLAALGEAKTAKDVCNAHTISQLRVFGHLKPVKGSDYCQLYVAVPHSATHELDRALVFAQLAGASHVRRLHIPDVMLRTCSGANR